MPKILKVSFNNLGSKHSLLMKFGKFMSYYKSKKFIRKFYKNFDLKTSPRSFCVWKKLGTTFVGKWNFRSKLLLSENSAHLPIPFYRAFFENKKDLELEPWPHFSYNFFDKKFIL